MNPPSPFTRAARAFLCATREAGWSEARHVALRSASPTSGVHLSLDGRDRSEGALRLVPTLTDSGDLEEDRGFGHGNRHGGGDAVLRMRRRGFDLCRRFRAEALELAHVGLGHGLLVGPDRFETSGRASPDPLQSTSLWAAFVDAAALPEGATLIVRPALSAHRMLEESRRLGTWLAARGRAIEGTVGPVPLLASPRIAVRLGSLLLVIAVEPPQPPRLDTFRLPTGAG